MQHLRENIPTAGYAQQSPQSSHGRAPVRLRMARVRQKFHYKGAFYDVFCDLVQKIYSITLVFFMYEWFFFIFFLLILACSIHKKIIIYKLISNKY